MCLLSIVANCSRNFSLPEVNITPSFLGITTSFLFMVLYTTVDVVFKRKWYFTIGMTAIVTVLSVVLTPDDLLSAVLTNYGALGSAILTIIPLLIILIFTVRIQSALVGRVLWMFYALYYFGFLLYMTLS